jgi:hypothetical protein
MNYKQCIKTLLIVVSRAKDQTKLWRLLLQTRSTQQTSCNNCCINNNDNKETALFSDNTSWNYNTMKNNREREREIDASTQPANGWLVLPRDRDARTHTRPRNENYKATPQQYNYRTINQPIYLSIYQSTIDVSLVTNQTQCLGQRTYTRNSLLTQQSYACETVATTRDSTKNLSTERGDGGRVTPATCRTAKRCRREMRQEV